MRLAKNGLGGKEKTSWNPLSGKKLVLVHLKKKGGFMEACPSSYSGKKERGGYWGELAPREEETKSDSP